MGSEAGVSDEKLMNLEGHATSDLYSDAEKSALAYADAITLSDQDAGDEIFSELQRHFTEDEIVELTSTICWENASSKFNRALRVDSQNLWKRQQTGD